MSKLVTIKLLKDWYAIPSTEIPESPGDFIDKCKVFKQGTIFEKHKTDKPDDDDSYDSPPHGWMYRTDDGHLQFCNFHAYVLDHWHQFKDRFAEQHEEVYTGFRVPDDWGKS